jgi:hypothetical protein
MAAAYRLGASYPLELEQDSFAILCFRLYLLLSHGKWYSKGSHRDQGVEDHEPASNVGEEGVDGNGKVDPKADGTRQRGGKKNETLPGVAPPGGN